MTEHKKRVRERKSFVYNAYLNKPEDVAVTDLVLELARKYRVTIVQIYNDIKEMKNAG